VVCKNDAWGFMHEDVLGDNSHKPLKYVLSHGRGKNLAHSVGKQILRTTFGKLNVYVLIRNKLGRFPEASTRTQEP